MPEDPNDYTDYHLFLPKLSGKGAFLLTELLENLHSAIWEAHEPAILEIFLKNGPPFEQPDDEDDLMEPPGSDHVPW